MACGPDSFPLIRSRPRLATLATLAILAACGSTTLRGQAPSAAPPAAVESEEAVAPSAASPATSAMTAATGVATQPATDPALVYVPPSAEAVLAVDLAPFADDEALHPLYRILLQGVLATAPIPPERLEDLERLTLFVVPYSAAETTVYSDPVSTPSAYLANTNVDSTSYEFGFVLHFADPFYERDLRRALGPSAERVEYTLIPAYRAGGSVVRLLENRYVLLMQSELPSTIVPFLDRDAYARTPAGQRLRALRRGETLRARAVVSGGLVRRLGDSYLTGDDAHLFQTFWNDDVEAWTLQFDASYVDEHTAYVLSAMIETDGEATAAALEEDLVGVVRLALAAARDYAATFATGEGDAADPVALVAASTFENMLSQRRLFVGHVGSAAGIKAVLLPEEIAEIPSMLGRLAGSTTAGTDALAEDRERQRRIVAALLAYRDAEGTFPSPVVYDDKSGEARSWRVELLPYLGERELFARYRTDEPWDSASNRALIAEIPDVYRSSFDRANPPGLAVAAMVHPRGVFSPDGPVAAGERVDPPASTMLTASVRLPLPWIQPQDIDAVGTEDLNDLAWTEAGVLAGFADGRVHLLQAIDAEQLRSFVVRDDGKPFSDLESIPGVEVDPEPAPEAERRSPPSAKSKAPPSDSPAAPNEGETSPVAPASPEGVLPPLEPAPNPSGDPDSSGPPPGGP